MLVAIRSPAKVSPTHAAMRETHVELVCAVTSVPVRDAIYAACLKVYGGLSARRSMSELEEAHDAGFLTTLPHFNSVLNVLDDPSTTPTRTEMVRLSALPLAAVEEAFAVDSTGFSTCRYSRWYVRTQPQRFFYRADGRDDRALWPTGC